MSAVPSTLIPATIAQWPDGMLRRLGACCRRIAVYFVHRDAIAWLHDCDDAALQDIGLARSEIEDAVRGRVSPSGRERRR